MTRMPKEELSELRRLESEATEAPWRWGWRREDENCPGSIHFEERRGQAVAVAMCPRYGRNGFKNDAALIVVIRNTLPRLLAEREEMETLLREAAPELRAGITVAGRALAAEIDAFLRPGAEAGK